MADQKAGLRSSHHSEAVLFHKIEQMTIHFAGNHTVFISRGRHHHQLSSDQLATPKVRCFEQLLGRRDFLYGSHNTLSYPSYRGSSTSASFGPSNSGACSRREDVSICGNSSISAPMADAPRSLNRRALTNTRDSSEPTALL